MVAYALESGLGTTIAKRYSAVRLIGSGGSAAVYEATDSTSGKTLALKWLLPELAAHPEAALRFRREYATLAQLRHPLVIRAHDYGLAEQRPYYTMDLLSGEDLRNMAPLDWRAACALLRDVASALAIVHSRRLVHRDVSSRNVRRTEDGRAKLLDFGALCPMGVAYDVVGTAPFVSPEQLAGEPLDARSDLFSLGALAYHLLTGRHAFPATSFAELYGMWSRRINAPSALAPGIPAALDGLVLSLLSLNPLTRPGSAAELFDRLTGVAGLSPGDAGESAQAYLVTPTLVAREQVIVRFRRRVLRAERRRGSTMVIEGQSGLGRSRMLASLLTEAKLRGMLAVYAEGEQGQRGPFAVAHALVRRLSESEPLLLDAESAMKSGVRSSPPGARIVQDEAIPPEEWPAVVDTISERLIAFAARVPLALGVDDVDACDEPSLAVLAKVADAAPSRRLLLIASAEPGSKRPAVERLRAAGSSQVLRPLTASETRQLVSSVFGDIPHVDGVAEWVHRLAEGSPRTALELSQHLVDRGLARYEQGGWTLPSSLDGLSLPESVHQALEAKIAQLRPLARKLADGLSLTADDEPLKLEEYATLLDDGDQVFDALNELVAASILVGQESTYVFANKSIKRGLEGAMSTERRRELHGRLSTAYAPSSSVLTAYHHFLAGEPGRAFSVLAAFIANRSEQVFRGISFARSEAGARFYEQMFEWGVDNGAPVTEWLLLGRAVLALGSAVDTRLSRHAPTILNRLQKDIGLVYWDEFDGVADPFERIRWCVGRAFAVREATPEHERGLDPITAMREFAACTASLAGVGARTADPDAVSALQQNMDRLRPLSPAVDVVADVIAYTALALRGWEVDDLRLRIVDRLAEPLPGLDETYREPIRMITMYYQALTEATSGDETTLDRLAVLEGQTPYAPLVWQARMVAHLYRGAGKQSEVCRRKRDLALVGRLDVDRQLEPGLVHEVVAYMLLGDLMALKRVLPELEERAQRWSGWMPHYLLAQGSYLGLRGDLGSALDLCNRAVTLVVPGESLTWFVGMSRVLRLMLQLGRDHEARDLGHSSLAIAAKYPSTRLLVLQLEMTLAIAEARTGESEAARQRAERVLAQAESTSTRGILLIDLLVGQAQVAQALNDDVAFAAASKQISELCAKVDSIAFATKLSSLLRSPLGAGFEPVDNSPASLNARGTSTQIDARLRTEIELCRGADERANRVLSTVLRLAGASQGFLYLNQPEGPTLVASRSNDPPPSELDEYLLKCIRPVAEGAGDETATTNAGATPFGTRFVFLPISTKRGEELVTVAVAMLDCHNMRPRIVRDTVLAVLADALIDAGDVHCE